MKRRLTIFIAVLACMALIFAACDQVDGLDLNKVLETNSSLESVEGNISLNLELVAGEDLHNIMMGNPMLLGFQQGLSLDASWKSENYNSVSLQGELTAAGQSVPVAFYTNGLTTVIEVEGIDRPLYTNVLGDIELSEDLVEHLTNPVANKTFNEAFIKYALFNLPNPNTIQVDRSTITVNDVQMNVRHLQAEVYGDELLELLKIYLGELKDDEEGLREAINATYDFVLPVIDAALEATYEENPFMDERTLQVIKAYLHNKTLVTEFIYTTVTEGLDYAVDEYDVFAYMIMSEGMKLFSDDTYIKVSTYINSKNEIVQNESEIMLALDNGESGQPSGIKLTATEQYWNHNGNVKADVLSSENGINLDHRYVGDAVLEAIDGDSVIGQMLTALGLNKKSSTIFIDDGITTVENGHTMYPAYSLAYLLDAEIEWSWDEDGAYIISHYGSDTTIIVTEGEAVMLVNGEPQELPVAPIDVNYSLYLPVRPVAEAFGYEVTWNSEDNAIVFEKTFF